MVENLKDRISDVVTGTTSKTIGALVEENMRQWDSTDSLLAPISTGFGTIDSLLGGFRLGEYIIIGGRPAMGKTQLLVNLAVQISAKQIPVLYFTIDLSNAMLTNRFLSSISEVPLKTMVTGKLSDADKNKILLAGEELGQQPIFINDMSQSSVEFLKGEAISTSQLSRAVESRPGSAKRPMLSDLRDSGAIEQDADQVIFIYRPEYYGITDDWEGNNLEGMVELIVAKNRNGETGIITLKRDENFINYKDFEVRRL